MEICFWEGSGAAHFLQNRESEVLSVLHSGHLILTVPLCYLAKDYQLMRGESNLENGYYSFAVITRSAATWQSSRKKGDKSLRDHCELAWQSLAFQ